MKLKRILSISAAAMLFLSTFTSSYAINTAELKDMKSKYIVVMDYDSGKILYEKNSRQKIYPASTTKIWTAFCVLQKCKDLNEYITVGDIPQIEGTSMYLEKGEKFTVKELLESLLINSSNDVAYVLADHFGDGDASKFVDYMNKEAKKYGATNTHFNNPHGLPDTNHYTTAYDMVILSRTAYANDTLKKIVSMKSVDFKKSDRCKLDRSMYNSNKFLTSSQTMSYNGKDVSMKYDIVDGIKTGYTDDALNCLVSTAQKDGIRTIAGVFYAPSGSLYHDSRLVLDYSFENFKREKVFDSKDFSGEKKVRFSNPSTIKYKLANNFYVVVEDGKKISKDDFTKKLNFDRLSMPVKKGDIIGTMDVYKKDELVSSIGLIAENSSKTYLQIIKEKIPFLNTSSDSKSEKEKSNSDLNDKKEKDSNTSTQSFSHIFTSIFSGIKGMFEGVFSMFGDIKNGSVSNFEKLPLYKFLEEKIQSTVPFVPAKFIIIGVPVIFILLILLLIFGIIIDSIRGSIQSKRNKKSKKKNTKNKDSKEKVNKNIEEK